VAEWAALFRPALPAKADAQSANPSEFTRAVGLVCGDLASESR
jgi:hypothetical protein